MNKKHFFIFVVALMMAAPAFTSTGSLEVDTDSVQMVDGKGKKKKKKKNKEKAEKPEKKAKKVKKEGKIMDSEDDSDS